MATVAFRELQMEEEEEVEQNCRQEAEESVPVTPWGAAVHGPQFVVPCWGMLDRLEKLGLVATVRPV